MDLQPRGPRLSHWQIPALYIAATVACGLLLPRIEDQYLAAFSHGMSIGSAQAFFSAIASGMMALTGFVFALAFVMVQFGAVAYSPRLVAWFTSDPMPFHALGVFVSTFIYAIAALAWLDRGGNGRVPLFSMLLTTGLLIASMLVFARLVQRIDELQLANVLHFIGHKGRTVIKTMFPVAQPDPSTARPSWKTAVAALREVPVTQTLRYSGEPWAIASLRTDLLVRVAEAADAVIVMECAVGDTLVDDARLLRVHGGKQQLPEAPLRQAIQVARERTFEQDPSYPLRLLVDIAIKALSPAINDPTTAVQAIDQIEDLLRRLGRRTLDAGCVADARGNLRLVFPTPDWEDYLTLAFDEIRHYGGNSIQVMRRLRSALLGLGESLTEGSRKEAVNHYLDHLSTIVRRSHLDAEDRQTALAEDRQGLGLDRRAAATSRKTGLSQ